jgi:hypothetical protein
MDKRFIGAGLGLLALAAILSFGPPGHNVTLKTGSLYPDEPPGMVGCYTSGTSGQLVVDDVAGTAIIETQSAHRYAVTWPIGYTGRSSMGRVEVIDTRGQVVTRTGDWVNMSGGYWTDGSFLACGEVH